MTKLRLNCREWRDIAEILKDGDTLLAEEINQMSERQRNYGPMEIELDDIELNEVQEAIATLGFKPTTITSKGEEYEL